MLRSSVVWLSRSLQAWIPSVFLRVHVHSEAGEVESFCGTAPIDLTQQKSILPQQRQQSFDPLKGRTLDGEIAGQIHFIYCFKMLISNTTIQKSHSFGSPRQIRWLDGLDGSSTSGSITMLWSSALVDAVAIPDRSCRPGPMSDSPTELRSWALLGDSGSEVEGSAARTTSPASLVARVLLFARSGLAVTGYQTVGSLSRSRQVPIAYLGQNHKPGQNASYR